MGIHTKAFFILRRLWSHLPSFLRGNDLNNGGLLFILSWSSKFRGGQQLLDEREGMGGEGDREWMAERGGGSKEKPI